MRRNNGVVSSKKGGFGLRALVPVLFLLSVVQVASAQMIPANAARTILLSGTTGAQSSVAYHAGFDQYYSAGIGTTSQPGYVSDSSGNLLQTQTPLNIDVRSINFNPNTGLMEVVTFNAVSGGVDRGLIEAQLDGSGLYTGGTATLLASMPGNVGSQSMPAYDPVRDRFYSRGAGNIVNIVARSDGSLLGTITLDFGAAGGVSATSEVLGFSSTNDRFVVTDSVNDTAVIFDLNGDYLGTSALDVTVPTSYGVGVANDQLFVATPSGYQGFDIGLSSSGEATAIPTLGVYGLILTGFGLLMVAVRRLSRK